MSTPERAAINRENAAKSTGPRTEAGKSHSKLNALNHGLASNQVVLPWESRGDYDALKASFETSHQPGSDLERHLLAQMVDCWWRLQRAQRVEAQFLIQKEQSIAQQADGLTADSALASMFLDPLQSSQLRLCMRYLAAAQKAWQRAVSDFEKEKKTRLQREREQDFLEAAMARAAAAATSSANTPPRIDPPLPPGFRYIQRNGVNIPFPKDFEEPAQAAAEKKAA